MFKASVISKLKNSAITQIELFIMLQVFVYILISIFYKENENIKLSLAYVLFVRYLVIA